MCKNSKYGFIDGKSFDEIVEPLFDSIDELCRFFDVNIDKYTKDLYITDNVLKLEKIADKENCRSFFVDKNEILKGRWGGMHDLISDNLNRDLYLCDLYYSSQHEYIPINIHGYFYNLFDCRKYDVVFSVISNIYLVEKNGSWGLIDDEFHVLLDLCYKDIQLVKLSALADLSLFVVSCDGGQFLYNPKTGLKTPVYESLFWYGDIYNRYKDYLVYGDNGKFGLIAPTGEIIIEAKFNSHDTSWLNTRVKSGCAFFTEKYNGKEYKFYIEDRKFYGKVSIYLYDYCIRIGNNEGDGYYLFNKDGKFGLLNKYCEEVDMPLFDKIIFAIDDDAFNNNFRKVHKTPISKTYMVGVVNGKYSLYSIPFVGVYNRQHREKVKLILDKCDEMEIIIKKKKNIFFIPKGEYPYVYFKKDGKDGYVNEEGEIISLDFFDKIDEILVENKIYYFIYKDKKIGLLDFRRTFILPCIYDEIKSVGRSSAIVVENFIEKEVRYNRNVEVKRDVYVEDEDSRHYSRYIGSYAQDEMGYSDEDIDTIFDGDPDAYWNID